MQTAFWQTTKHAHALAALQRKGRAGDPSCVGCHVTGYLLPGGTSDIKAATSTFAEVGCKSCHGPGAVHVQTADKKTGTTRRMEPAVCLGCHTPDQTNKGFDVPAFFKAILGKGHGA